MNSDQATRVLQALAGYWPRPAMTDEECQAFMVELLGPAHVTLEEAETVVHREAEGGRQWRPLPGEIISLVTAERHQRRQREPRPALGAGCDYCGGRGSAERGAEWATAAERHRLGIPRLDPRYDPRGIRDPASAEQEIAAIERHLARKTDLVACESCVPGSPPQRVAPPEVALKWVARIRALSGAIGQTAGT